MTNKDLGSNKFFKQLSPQDFRNFGREHIAYIRPVSVQNKTAYAIHAADGTPLSVLDKLELAMIVVRQNDLEAATVH